MSNKKHLVSGSIMKIPLEKGIGFGYAKLIWSHELDPAISENLIIKVYEKFSPKEDKTVFDSEEFETDDLLIYPLLSASYPPLRGPQKWQFLGVADLTEEDWVIPDFISTGQFGEISSLNLMINCTKTKQGTMIIRNCLDETFFTKDFASIEHMSRWQHFAPQYIREVITMFLVKLKWDEIRSHLEYDKAGSMDWIKIMKNKAAKRNLDIRKLKRVDRMKARITTDLSI